MNGPRFVLTLTGRKEFSSSYVKGYVSRSGITELTFDSGFKSPFVSGNSIPIECGGNLSGGFLLDIRNSFQPPARGGKNR